MRRRLSPFSLAAWLGVLVVLAVAIVLVEALSARRRRGRAARLEAGSRARATTRVTFEAMTSDRPYRRAPGQDFALAELSRHSGTQFDPDVVDALTRVLDRTARTEVAPMSWR